MSDGYAHTEKSVKHIPVTKCKPEPGAAELAFASDAATGPGLRRFVFVWAWQHRWNTGCSPLPRKEKNYAQYGDRISRSDFRGNNVCTGGKSTELKFL